MRSGSSLNACLTRRGWLVLTASALSACGGGSATTSSLPGTGGTGIYAQGSIWGFGSVRVNGIKFDDTAATVQIDGQAGKSSDLRLGMVAGIQGLRGADVTLAIANSIEVWSIAQGPIASSLPGQFTLAGMTLQTDSGTVFDGIASGTDTGIDGQGVGAPGRGGWQSLDRDPRGGRKRDIHRQHRPRHVVWIPALRQRAADHRDGRRRADHWRFGKGSGDAFFSWNQFGSHQREGVGCQWGSTSTRRSRD
jgi:hypothetical protein